jgi:hypothetical protein
MESPDRWYVLEMKGGGLLTVCLPSRPTGQQLLLRQEPEIPNVCAFSIAANSYEVLKDYESRELAMAFIAGLELGHQRLRESEEKLTRIYQSKRKASHDF